MKEVIIIIEAAGCWWPWLLSWRTCDGEADDDGTGEPVSLPLPLQLLPLLLLLLLMLWPPWLLLPPLTLLLLLCEPAAPPSFFCTSRRHLARAFWNQTWWKSNEIATVLDEIVYKENLSSCILYVFMCDVSYKYTRQLVKQEGSHGVFLSAPVSGDSCFFSPLLFLANEKPTPPDVHYQTKPHGVWLDVFLSIFSV